MRGSMKAYKSVAIDSQKSVASPYQIVKLLLAGSLERLAKSRVAIEQKNYEQRGELISSTLLILAELRMSLDHEAGGEIATNLDKLYEFIMGELVEANSENNIEQVENASRLLREIKVAWDNIPTEFQS
ncbi:flagellar export chaperone FliS [Oceanimonas sp. CHS3-5]|uniref:flagellar export chaperone FliS n=1 Tax=Oceanimonas sp. CHS3-5 TaxID=3068186 RepID=UPI00273D7BE5|nr:flagellar export chaperone FliS [Oceanimonas sp. CHS3-5]MDP5290699.1 flagellar export chaperone FliS [Oceanimonas sp. CHS3-5]